MNHQDKSSVPDRLDQATSALRQTPIADELSHELILRAEQIRFSDQGNNVRRIRFIAAAIVILCLGGAVFFLLQRTESVAFADVVQSVDQTHTLTATLDVDAAGSSLNGAKCFVRDRDMRIETAAGVQVINHAIGQRLVLNTLTHAASIDHNMPDAQYDLYQVIRNCDAGSAQSLGEKTIDGHPALGFRATSVVMPGEVNVFWVDKATKLPVRVEIGPIVMSNLHFDLPLADSLFNADVPAGYALQKATEARLQLAGEVIDQQGNPIAGVEAQLTERDIDVSFRTMRYLGPAARTDQHGHFAIDCKTAGAGDNPIRLEFNHPDFLYARLEDLRLFPQEARSHLQVRLNFGSSVTGQVVDEAGHSVSGAVIRSMCNQVEANDYGNLEVQGEYSKYTATDDQGRFALHGLPAAKIVLQVQKGAGSILLTAQAEVKLSQATTQPASLQIAAKPLALPAGSEIHQLLGMKLVDIDPSLRDRLPASPWDTVLVLDPGSNVARLGIGELQAGDIFWDANNVRVKNFHDFAQQLLAAYEAQQKQGRTECSVQVVYDFTRPTGGGSNTQYMRLNPDDLAELKKTVQP